MIRKVIIFMVAGAFTADAYALDDGSQMEVRYCGIGYLGQAADISKNYPYLASTVLSKDVRPSLGNLLKTVSEDANPRLRFVGEATDALSYVISAAKYELQKYKNPLPPYNQMFNVIYTLTIQTVLFNKDSKEIKGVYPWTYQFNDASPEKPSDAVIAAKFKSFFDLPPPLKEGEEPDPQLFMVQWREAMADFNPIANAKTIAVAPVQFSEAAAAALAAAAPSGGTEGAVMALGTELTSALEAELSEKLGLPVIPGGGAPGVDGKSASQFVAAIPDCLNAGSESFSLPAPSYRFFLGIAQVASASRVSTETRESVGADGAIAKESIKSTEIGYGARYSLNVVAPDETDTSEWGGQRLITDHKLRFIGAKRFTGDRTLNEFDQHRKLSLAFMGELADGLMSRNEKWIKDHLSADIGKTKPSAVRKEWIEVFEKRMGLARSKKKKEQ